MSNYPTTGDGENAKERELGLQLLSDVIERLRRPEPMVSYAKMIAVVPNAEAQEPLKFEYRHIYFPFSDYAHPTPTAIRHVLPRSAEDIEPVLLPYGVPLYAAIAATQLCGYAAEAGGVRSRDSSDLIERFVRAMPQPLQ